MAIQSEVAKLGYYHLDIMPASAGEIVEYLRRLQGNGFWYVASPYSRFPGGIEAANAEACRAGGWLINQGVHVFVPIPHSHALALLGGIAVDNHDTWLEQDKAIANHAVGLVIVKLNSWDTSFGVNEERKWFAGWGKPEVLLPWPINDGGK